jgi:hypothetical protein
MTEVLHEMQDKSALPSRTFLLATNDQGQQIVSIHVKRTYRLKPDGRCVRAEGEIPLLLGPTSAEDTEAFPETDIIPFKGRTDLIVMTKAWGRGAKQVTAQIRVGQRAVQYRVSGDRRVVYHGQGSWSFTQPEPFESVEMRYENAYGGFDESVPDPKVEHIVDMLDFHPGQYPRNPVGKGYVVFDRRERIDGLALPNIEDPTQLLRQDRLLTGRPEDWWKQPLPWSCNWYPKLCYPRIVHFRGVPSGLPIDDRQVAEVQRGWLDPGHARKVAAMTLSDPLDGRCADAASPSLVFPRLRGDEAIELTALTPDGHMAVQLSRERPRILVRWGGKVHEVAPVPHRILISALEMGVYVVWHGAWIPPRPLPGRRPRPDDTMATLLEGVEVFVDDKPIAPLGSETAT